MEEKSETNNISQYIENNKFLLLSLLLTVVIFISINFNIYSEYAIDLFNNIYFKFALFLILIHISFQRLKKKEFPDNMGF